MSAVATGFLVTSWVLNISIWKHTQKCENTVENEKKLTFLDILSVCRICLDFLQFLSLVPTLSFLQSMALSVGTALSINFEELYLQKGSFFWVTYTIYLSLAVLYLILRLCSFKFRVPFPYIWIPLCSDLLATAVLSALLNIYTCFEAQSVFHYDCQIYCWGPEHLKYLVPGSVAFLAYVLVSPLDKFNWQTYYPDGPSVSFSADFMLYKSLLVATLLSLRKILITAPIIYSTFYTTLFTVYFILTIKVRPFNVPIVSLAYSSVILMVLSVQLIYFAQVAGALSDKVLVPLLLTMWAIVLVSAVVLKYIKDFTWPFETAVENESELYRFAFSLKQREFSPTRNHNTPTSPCRATSATKRSTSRSLFELPAITPFAVPTD